MPVIRSLIIFVFFLVLVFLPQHVFAETTPYRSAGWVSQYPGSNFINLNNCQATDGLYCSRPLTSGYGDLFFSSFGNLQAFGIPQNSTITKLHIRITARNNTVHLITLTGLKNSTSTQLCADPAGVWQFISNNSLITTEYNTDITFANHLTNCITASRIDIEALTFNFIHSGPEPWYADVDNFEIAFDYTPAPTPTGIPTPTPTPTVTPTPTPTPLPTPEPFLDLPWNYEGSFENSALKINSYFDHTYPLLSSGLIEPTDFLKQVTTYQNENSKEKSYSAHDGYDYGLRADVHLGDPVLAAAAGWATYISTCEACGNMIEIDHGNAYQTRYMHLQKDGLVTDIPNNPVWVADREVIGKVGATGNVTPAGDAGAHIHFGVVQDKNKDGNFDDNIPDGLTDPFGWQSTEPDPWGSYSFFYNGKQRTGNKSYYLWTKQIPNLQADLPSNGGVFNLGKNEITFPYDPTRPPLGLTISYTPYAKASDSLVGITPTLDIIAKDVLGNVDKFFTGYITIKIDFSDVDLSRFDLGTTTFSIYSSDDQGHWLKEPTVIDLTGKTATTQVNHLTYFALMAERKDTIAPVTTATLSGQMGQNSWYRSDVQVALNAQDNNGGLGVDYTLYKLDDNDWQTYTEPFIFTTEGHHTVEFYSGDKDGNIEDVKTEEFNIDKIPPQVTIDANPKTLWPPDGSMVDVKITGSSQDNSLVGTTFNVIDEYGLVQPQISGFAQTIQLQAKRDGNDEDGRAYIIFAKTIDKAGNESSASTTVRVLHDQGQ